MTGDIVEKLRKHLAGKIDTECETVYLLCEVRKLLERVPHDEFFALRMYCHWAVHVDLDRASTTLPFLRKLDRYVSRKLNEEENLESLKEERSLLQDFVYLDTFRRELSEFLAMHSLPTSLCDENPRWFPFLAAYAGVIEDGSLSCQAKAAARALRVVERVIFSKSARKADDGHVPFIMKWDILLTDGRTLELEVGTQANHGLLQWGLSLSNG